MSFFVLKFLYLLIPASMSYKDIILFGIFTYPSIKKNDFLADQACYLSYIFLES